MPVALNIALGVSWFLSVRMIGPLSEKLSTNCVKLQLHWSMNYWLLQWMTYASETKQCVGGTGGKLGGTTWFRPSVGLGGQEPTGQKLGIPK